MYTLSTKEINFLKNEVLLVIIIIIIPVIVVVVMMFMIIMIVVMILRSRASWLFLSQYKNPEISRMGVPVSLFLQAGILWQPAKLGVRAFCERVFV
jgi:hypothetical protein